MNCCPKRKSKAISSLAREEKVLNKSKNICISLYFKVRVNVKTMKFSFACCLLPSLMLRKHRFRKGRTVSLVSTAINTNHYHSLPFLTIHYHSLPFNTIHYHSLPIITIHYQSLPWQWDCASEGLRKRGTAKARDNGTMWQWECPRGRECATEGLWNRGTAQARDNGTA